MNKTEVLQILAGLFFIGILFTPTDSDIWKYFLGAGFTFGSLWFYKLN